MDGVRPDPGNLTSFRDQAGRTYTFDVTGSDQGPVWGSGIYTDDSSLATAAVHAGLLRVGQRGQVTVMLLPGRDSYAGSDPQRRHQRALRALGGQLPLSAPPAAPAPAPGTTPACRSRRCSASR